MAISKSELLQQLTELAFSRPLVSNIYRGLVAEVIVGSVLSESWKHCSDDWNGWDFAHVDGCKLEVKQSAVLQSWSTGKLSPAVFNIAPAKGFYDGEKWTEKAGRQASIYVFAHHDIGDVSVADHRDAEQWKFYVMPSESLPDFRSIALVTLKKVSRRVWNEVDPGRDFPCDLSSLGESVDVLHAHLRI